MKSQLSRQGNLPGVFPGTPLAGYSLKTLAINLLNTSSSNPRAATDDPAGRVIVSHGIATPNPTLHRRAEQRHLALRATCRRACELPLYGLPKLSSSTSSFSA